MKNSCIEANWRFTISENSVVQPLLKDLFPFSPQKVEKKVTEYTPSVLKMLSSFTNQKNARWIVVVSTVWKGPLSYFLLFSSGCFHTTIRAEGRKRNTSHTTKQKNFILLSKDFSLLEKLIHMPTKLNWACGQKTCLWTLGMFWIKCALSLILGYQRVFLVTQPRSSSISEVKKCA